MIRLGRRATVPALLLWGTLAAGCCGTRWAARPEAARGAPPAVTVEQALRLRRPVLLLFTTPGCALCRRLEQETLADPRVQAHLRGYALVRVDASLAAGKALAREHGVEAYPTWVRLAPTGQRLAIHAGHDAPEVLLRRLPRP